MTVRERSVIASFRRRSVGDSAAQRFNANYYITAAAVLPVLLLGTDLAANFSTGAASKTKPRRCVAFSWSRASG
jgi:hypothetical protein